MTAAAPAVVTLTTDFGTRDTYVAEMKGAILGITRAVHLVDLTHAIDPQDVLGAAFVLERAALRFPPGTIHLAVVDPGVGTSRRGLVVSAAGQRFVGPDNGLFTPFLDAPGWEAFELAAEEYRAQVVSPAFHGRDVFAPAAAHLALGVGPRRFGPPVDDPVRLESFRLRDAGEGGSGTVLHVDRFGNLVTSIRGETVAALGPGARVWIGGRHLRVVGTYGDLRRGEPGGLIGSDGRLEIAVREGSAAWELGVGPGARVSVSPPTFRTTRASRTKPRASRTRPGTSGTKPGASRAGLRPRRSS